MQTKISIIIPVYYSSVDNLIDNVTSQIKERNDVEIILAGKGSYKTGKNIRFYETVGKDNPSIARNLAIKKSRGKWLYFIDSDCIPSRNWIKHLEKHDNPVVGGSVDFDSSNYWALCDNVACFYNLNVHSKNGKRDNIATINMRILKSIAVNAGMFDEKLDTSEDLDFILKVKKLGYGIYFEPKASVIHNHKRDGFKSIIKHAISWSKNSYDVRKKHSLIPKIFKNKAVFVLASPFISAYVTIKVFSFSRFSMMRYWRTIPIIYIFKLIWCIGSAI